MSSKNLEAAIESGRKKPKVSVVLVKRKCLRCDRPFVGRGQFNRLCEKCQAINAKQGLHSYAFCARKRGGKWVSGY